MEINAMIKQVETYYHKGLNYKEIALLLNISTRTVQRYIDKSGCRQAATLKALPRKALEMSGQGMSYTQIAKALGVSKTTVYLWHRKAKTQKNTPDALKQ